MPKTVTPDEHKAYDRSARWWDIAETCLEGIALIDSLRRSAWAAASGPLVLEIGVGSGRGLRFHPPDARVVAFDFSPSLLKRAVAKAEQTGSQADLLLADVNYLPFKSSIFDTILATFVFCMVPHPVHALSEVARACRSDGQVVLLEHVRPENPLGRVMDALNRFTVRGGEYVNRRTAAEVRKARLEIAREETYRMGIVKLLHARPGDAPAAASRRGGDDAVPS